ncbi:MAG: pantoate--beta-alanine ligase [Planctomycetaceae bacterium]|nr:pantoate--beta-alanine ligase [Planctomycetaceae bacterium]
MNASASISKLATTIAQIRAETIAARRAGVKIGLVPTMGALHEGHLSLVRASKAECGLTVVSIFVNPTQFGPNEDFSKYPRTLDNDLKLLAACGAEVAFAPEASEMYRSDRSTTVDVGEVAEPLEGEFRPGHFRGVATVVLKLFNIVQPDVAFFGQKDFQQVQVVRRMVADLNVSVDVRACPIVREPDGLAMSSRNRYLSPAARRRALVLSRSLKRADELVRQGQCDAAVILAEMRAVIETAEDARIDYIALVDPETFRPAETIAGPTLAALAVKIENTRLIDNCLLSPRAPIL